MSHGIEESDALVLVGEPAWHGLGTVIPRSEGLTVREGAERVLPWEVDLRPLYTRGTLGGFYAEHSAPGQAVVRTQPGTPETVLACVGPDFEAFHNRQFIDLLSKIDDHYPEASLETIGTLRGGRQVFGLLNLGLSFAGARSLETANYIALLNGHDGSRAVRAFPTGVRVVCANTEAYADEQSKGRGFTGYHRTGLSELVEAFEADIGLGLAAKLQREQEDLTLGSHQVGTLALYDFFSGVYSVYTGKPFPGANPQDKKEVRALTRATEACGAMCATFEAEGDKFPGIRGSAYLALQGATGWANRRPRVRDRSADLLTGKGAAICRSARDLALAL